MRRGPRWWPLLVLLVGLGACRPPVPPSPIGSPDLFDLVSVHHNPSNACTLLAYRSPTGEVRHILRRDGVFVVMLTYGPSGVIRVQFPGERAVVVDPHVADRISASINGGLETRVAGPQLATDTDEGRRRTEVCGTNLLALLDDG